MGSSVAKNIYYAGVALLQLHRRRTASLKRDGKIAVLNLHRVSDASSPYWPPMKPAVFESLLVFLKANFDLRLFRDLNESVGSRPIAVLSFDDGYYDFLEYALPILRRHGLSANMNVIPQCAESGEPIWNVQLYDFLAAAPMTAVNKLDIPGFGAKLTGGTESEKLRFGLQLSRYLKSLSRAKRLETWGGIAAPMADTEYPRTRMMSTDEIKSIAGEVEIGVHSFSHESMGNESTQFFEKDLDRCQEYFEQGLALPLSIYAFPNGSYRPEHIEILTRRGFDQILLVDEEFASHGANVIPRLTMYGETAREVAMRVLAF